MKNINVYGVYRPERKNPVLDFHHDELARYLAKTRGPMASASRDHSAAAADGRSGARGVQGI